MGLIPPFLFDPPFLVSLLLCFSGRMIPLYMPLRRSDFRLFSHNSKCVISSRPRYRLIKYSFESKSSNQRQKKRNKRLWWKNHERENSPNDTSQQCTMTTRNLLGIKSRDQVDDVFYQLHLSRRIPNSSYNFMSVRKLKKLNRTDLFHVKLSLWIISGIEKLAFVNLLFMNGRVKSETGPLTISWVWWVGIFQVRVFPGGIFLEPI